MDNNEVLRGVRYALHLKNSKVAELFALGECEVTVQEAADMLRHEDHPDYLLCTPEQLHCFLDGLITFRRGPHDGPKPKINYKRIDNNMLLRKLRIAFHLRDTDVIAILKLGNFNLSKSELGAMSRKAKHENYVKCGDQVIRYFLKGLVKKYRSEH